MTKNIEKYLLSEDRQLACSLISKYPYSEVKDVIKETCLHQVGYLIEKGWKSPGEVNQIKLKQSEIACDNSYEMGIKEGRRQLISELLKRAYPEDDGLEFFFTKEEWHTLRSI